MSQQEPSTDHGDPSPHPTAKAFGPARDGLASGTIAQKLDHLFRTVHPAGSVPYSNDHVSKAMAASGGPKISGQYIWYLRTGQRTNPTVDILEALAQFFGVSLAYFFNDEYVAKVDADLHLLGRLRDAGVTQILTRASDLARLSETSRQAIIAMIEHALRLEGLESALEDDPTSPDR